MATSADLTAIGVAGANIYDVLSNGSNAARSSSNNDTYGYNSSSNASNRAISAKGKEVRDAGYDKLLGLLGSDSFSKEAAIRDSQGAITEIFNNYKTTDLPKIFSGQISSGGYNSTSHQMLANDAFAQATAKGAALRTDTILKYANARRQELDPLISLLNNDFEQTSEGGSFGENFGSSTAIGAAGATSASSDKSKALGQAIGTLAGLG